MKTSQKEIDLLIEELASIAGLKTTKAEAIKAGHKAYLSSEYASVYGGHRLIMVNVNSGGHGGAFGYSGTEGRVKANEFTTRLRALIIGIEYKNGQIKLIKSVKAVRCPTYCRSGRFSKLKSIMYQISVVKDGECTFLQTVSRFEEIRDVLEIDGDEDIIFQNGMFTREISESESCNVMELSAREVKNLGLGVILSLNKSETHVMFKGDFYEIYEDQAGDNYFHYKEGHTNITCYIEPIYSIHDAIFQAEEFVSGFEDDESQEGVDKLLKLLRQFLPKK